MGEGAAHPVSGRVNVGGRSAGGVEVRLYPLNRHNDPEAPRPYAITDKDGRFRLRLSEDHEGAPPGQYVATLVWPSGRGGADRLGGAFADPQGSGLTALIGGDTSELSPFEVSTPATRKGGTR